MAYSRYWALCKTAESGPYLTVKVFIESDNSQNATKMLKALYGNRLVGFAQPA